MTAARRLGSLLRRGAATADRRSSAITDQQLERSLGRYAGMADRILDQPERWLGVDEPAAPRSALGRLAGAARRSVSGDVHPGSRDWGAQPLPDRTRWWVRRITATAGTAAAAPRLAGLLADRVPVQAALGASASGLAVCAVARENGIEDPEDWVPLLARVILGRDLQPTRGAVPDHATSEQALTEATAAHDSPDTEDPGDKDPGTLHTLGEGGQRAARGMWRLARTLLEIQGVFDERPHGGVTARLLARLPVVGVAGGWLDERGGILASARETQSLIGSGRH